MSLKFLLRRSLLPIDYDLAWFGKKSSDSVSIHVFVSINNVYNIFKGSTLWCFIMCRIINLYVLCFFSYMRCILFHAYLMNTRTIMYFLLINVKQKACIKFLQADKFGYKTHSSVCCSITVRSMPILFLVEKVKR